MTTLFSWACKFASLACSLLLTQRTFCAADGKTRDVLNRMVAYDNIPRKKAKFENFCRNSLAVGRCRVNGSYKLVAYVRLELVHVCAFQARLFCFGYKTAH